MKKILLTLGSTLLTVAPISVAISCGSKPKTNHQDKSEAKHDVSSEQQNTTHNIISGNSDSTDVGDGSSTHNIGLTINEQDIHISQSSVALVEAHVSEFVSSFSDEQINYIIDSIKENENVLTVSQIHLVLTKGALHKDFLINIEASKAIDANKMKEALANVIAKDINADELLSLINLTSLNNQTSEPEVSSEQVHTAQAVVDFTFPQQGKQSVEEIWDPIFREQSQSLHIGESLKLTINGKVLMHILTNKDIDDINALIVQGRQEPMLNKIVELLKTSTNEFTTSQIKQAMGFNN